MNERLFDGKGAVYGKFRPGYPSALSSSYAPRSGETAYEPFRQVLAALFQKYSRNGALPYPYVTWCYDGGLKD